ncbi:MAG: hypothetical protein V3S18_07345 [Dehalococcoidia bacterium]
MTALQRVAWRGIVAAVVGVAALWLAPLAASADQPEPILRLGPTTDAKVGEGIVIAAYLVDPAGKPVAGQEIDFTLESTFLNVTHRLDLEVVTTDESGLAWFLFEPRTDGENLISAQFAGNQVFAPAQVETILEVAPGPELYREVSIFRVPGTNVWMVTGILAVVWSVYLVGIGFMWAIARASDDHS